MAQVTQDRLTYTGANLPAVAVILPNVPALVGTFTGATISIPNTITGDCIFTIYRKAYNAANFSAFTTLTIPSGSYKATITGSSQACVAGDSWQVALTTLPASQTINAGIDFYLDYTADTDASTTEVLTGTDAAKNVTANALAALWEQGSDIASAGTISVGEGGYFNVTGTTTITDIDFATDKAGRKVWLKFAGILTLTHNSTTLILPTGASITTAAGDIACFVSEGTDNVRCISYTRASGAALVSSALSDGDKGDITVSSSGTVWTIDNNAITTAKILDDNVTLAKIANAAANSKLLGSGDAGSGANYVELSLGTNLSMSGTTLNASPGTLTEYTSASASGPGSIYFAEDTDNGTNKVTVIAPSAIASDKTQTLQDATGTIALTSDLSAYQPLDSDLTTIAGLTATTDNFIQSKSSAWASRTVAQVSADLQGTGLITDAVGFRTVPINSQSAAYTTLAADSGKVILHPAADNNARTFTIDSNANVAYPVGTVITFINMINTVTISITSDTLTLMGAGTTGSRTLAANGIATALKISSTAWVISGTNLT
jgi:hypothetical protein